MGAEGDLMVPNGRAEERAAIQSAPSNLPLHLLLVLFCFDTIITGSRGSSVSVVHDYGLDDRGSIPDRGRGFFL
jgi:hypothetical protein